MAKDADQIDSQMTTQSCQVNSRLNITSAAFSIQLGNSGCQLDLQGRLAVLQQLAFRHFRLLQQRLQGTSTPLDRR